MPARPGRGRDRAFRARARIPTAGQVQGPGRKTSSIAPPEAGEGEACGVAVGGAQDRARGLRQDRRGEAGDEAGRGQPGQGRVRAGAEGIEGPGAPGEGEEGGDVPLPPAPVAAPSAGSAQGPGSLEEGQGGGREVEGQETHGPSHGAIPPIRIPGPPRKAWKELMKASWAGVWM